MAKNDLSIMVGDYKLNVRCCAFIKKEGKVLLEANDLTDYLVPVGGRCEAGEDSLSALVREIEEETGTKVSKEDARLIGLVENFFSLDNKNYHEYLFLYEVNGKAFKNFDNIEVLDHPGEHESWYDLDKVEDLSIQPACVKDMINSSEFKHIINKDK